jgi:hypothetical protein
MERRARCKYTQITAVNQEKAGESVMCILEIHIRGCDRFFEVLPNEVEKAELTVESGVSQVLLDLFGEVIVDDVTICFSSDLGMGIHNCSIDIRAQCSCECFALYPCTKEHMKLTIEERVCALLKELFGSVNVEHVTMAPPPWDYGNDPALPCRL